MFVPSPIIFNCHSGFSTIACDLHSSAGSHSAVQSHSPSLHSWSSLCFSVLLLFVANAIHTVGKIIVSISFNARSHNICAQIRRKEHSFVCTSFR
jgi:hypothetical protein